MASVVLAVLLAVIMRSMQLGTYGKMVRDVVGTFSGYIQVHEKGYWDDKTINNTCIIPDSLKQRIRSIESVTGLLPRLESFALASQAERTRGVMVVGTVPSRENSMTGLAEKITKGTYLNDGDDGILVAEGLADFLKLDVGDTMVLLGQGYHGISAAGAYPVQGILHFASPELNRGFTYMDIGTAQNLFSTGNRVTSLVVNIDDRKNTASVTEKISGIIDTDIYEVMTWDEMLTELVQQIKGDNAGGLIMLGILYVIVGFGIFGTIMMMTTERKREFGMVNALGFTLSKISIMVCFETLFIAVVSAVTGIILSLPIVLYFYNNPIRLTGEAAKGMINFGVEPVMPFALEAGIFLSQTGLVLIMTTVAALYPLLVVKKLEPVSAMRS
jgi:ABC-type lipoprotein release transport system permease subunit